MTMALRHRSFGALLLFMTVNFAVPLQSASAQEQPSTENLAHARQLFNEGMDQRERGDPLGALEKLRAAHALANTPITGIELGRTYLSLGRLVLARETFLSVDRIARRPQETARSAAARTESASLAEQVRLRIPKVTLKVSEAANGLAMVAIDGAPVPLGRLEGAHDLDPGTHRLVAQTVDGTTAEASVDLREGETHEVELKFPRNPVVIASASVSASKEAPPAQRFEEPRQVEMRHLGPLVYGGLGVGGVALVVGSATGILAFSKASAVKRACDGSTCPRSVDSDLQSGRTLATVSTIGFVVAGVGAATGVMGWVLGGRARSPALAAGAFRPWVGPGSVGVDGSF